MFSVNIIYTTTIKKPITYYVGFEHTIGFSNPQLFHLSNKSNVFQRYNTNENKCEFILLLMIMRASQYSRLSQFPIKYMLISI
jgi:hypothetical protein